MITAITGASGHVGANLVRALLDEGRKVRALVRKDRRAIEGLDIETVEGDLNDPASLMELCKGADVVYHCAAHISITTFDRDLVERTNIEGTKNLLSACMNRKVKRLVHFSSIHAFDSPASHETVDEDSPLCEGNSPGAYDRTKALAQIEVLSAVEKGLNTVIVNPTSVLGPYDYKISRMGATIMDMCLNRIPALPNGGFNWVDARDVAAGAIAAEKKGRNGQCYLLGGHWHHVKDVSAMLARITGNKTPRLVMPLWLCALASYGSLSWAHVRGVTPRFTPYAIKTIQRHRNISYGKAERELGYRSRPLEETLRDTIQWLKESGIMEQYADR